MTIPLRNDEYKLKPVFWNPFSQLNKIVRCKLNKHLYLLYFCCSIGCDCQRWGLDSQTRTRAALKSLFSETCDATRLTPEGLETWLGPVVWDSWTLWVTNAFITHDIERLLHQPLLCRSPTMSCSLAPLSLTHPPYPLPHSLCGPERGFLYFTYSAIFRLRKWFNKIRHASCYNYKQAVSPSLGLNTGGWWLTFKEIANIYTKKTHFHLLHTGSSGNSFSNTCRTFHQSACAMVTYLQKN